MSYEITKAYLQEIGERVKQIQKLAALTNFEIATLLGISEIQYDKLLRGVSMITEDKFLRLHRELGVSLDFLFTGYEREGKFISGEGKILTDVEFYIFSNEIANYVKQLPLERKKQKMMEMVIMFHKIFETI